VSDDEARRSFALYLETSGPGARAEAARRRVDQAQMAAARARWSDTLLGPTVDRSAVETALGPADEAGVRHLGYRLPTRPDHLFVFRFDDPAGRLTRAGFRRLDERPAPPDEPRATLAARLVAMETTLDDLERWYGCPTSSAGWWPLETFTFANGLTLELRHGVAESSSRHE
jgi:hypothetical protein